MRPLSEPHLNEHMRNSEELPAQPAIAYRLPSHAETQPSPLQRLLTNCTVRGYRTPSLVLTLQAAFAGFRKNVRRERAESSFKLIRLPEP